MKWGYFLLTKDNPQGQDHFTMYAMTDAADNYENMKIMHDCYTEELKLLQNSVSPLGKEIYCVGGGDFKHVSNMDGHHGPTSKYPSIYSLMPNNHVKYHEETGRPHNKLDPNCVFDERCPDEMYGHFIEGTITHPNNPRAGGKVHCSIIGSPLFPLKYGAKKQIMWPALHVFTGLITKMLPVFITTCTGKSQNMEVGSS